jgi:hypothetical protein
MAQVQNIYIDQGTTYSLSLNVTDQNGDLKDLSDYTVAAQMRKSYYTNTAIDFDAEITYPLDGELTISLTSENSSDIKAGRYVYDIEITGEGETLRVLEGIVVINPEVTK